MTQIRVVACLPKLDEGGLEAKISETLAPFEMYSGVEWREMWDSWTIRGGSDGTGFTALPGFEQDARLIHDLPRYDGAILPSRPGDCAGGPKGIIDVGSARESGPWDLLTIDGWWIEDRKPVHGACSSPEECPHMETGFKYAEDSMGYLENLTADTLIVKLLCHG